MKYELWENTYLLDGIPITPLGLIKEAAYYDKEFEKRTIRFATEAAEILEKHGLTVERSLPEG